MSTLFNARRFAAIPATLVVLSALAGCGNKSDDAGTTTPAPTTAPSPAPTQPTPPGPPPAAPGGPGGTMMNKPSTNPNGATGDGVITVKVKSALLADTKVGATTINVDTKSNTVVLRGTVKTEQAKTAAEADAKKIEGVSKVINQLTVKP